MNKFVTLLYFAFLLLFSAYSQIPDGYYDSIIGKKKATLKTSLHQKIKIATVLSYGGGDGKTWSGFAKTDVRPADGKVWDMYSNEVYSFNANLSVTGMNIEHSFAKSWWGGTETQAYKDLHHLNPSDATANQRKSSYLMAVVDSTVTYTNGVIKVGKTKMKSGMLLPAWEPADQYKGDFARIYMYMVTAYEDYAALWTNDSENQLDNNTYPVFEPWAINLLLKWAKQDPVSEKETYRNNEVYKIQGNRNPFIDFQDMAEYVWGDLKYKPFTYNGIVDYPYLNFPDQLDTLTFGKVYFQQSALQYLSIQAENLTGDLQLEISGIDQTKFRLSKTVLSKSEVESGLNLPIEFDATEPGKMNAILTISGGGIEPIKVVLNANVSEEFIALPATNVGASYFRANWTIFKGTSAYLLDVFSLRPTGTYLAEKILEQNFRVSLPNNWIKGGYTEMSYSETGAIRLGKATETGKLSLPLFAQIPGKYRLTVIAKQYSNDSNAALTVNVNNQSQVVWTTSVAYKEFKVDLVIPNKETVISLSAAELGKRVYIDNLILEYLRPEQSKNSIENYPRNVGNALNHNVLNLWSDSVYYYTVVPIENSNLVSSSIWVKTDITLDLAHNLDKSYTLLKNDQGVIVRNISADTYCNVYDVNGTLILEKYIQSDNFFVPLPHKGIFIFQFINSESTENHKFVF